MANHRRVNNVGWVNDQNYRKDDETPLLAVVGDPYTEALRLPNTLATNLEHRLRVYRGVFFNLLGVAFHWPL